MLQPLHFIRILKDENIVDRCVLKLTSFSHFYTSIYVCLWLAIFHEAMSQSKEKSERLFHGADLPRKREL